MKVIQLTDSHIGTDDDDSFGIDVRQNMLILLDAIRAECPDLIVHTGDLCLKEPKEDIYNWISDTIHKYLSDYQIRYVPGNHDFTPWILKYLDKSGHHLIMNKDGEWYYSELINGVPFIYLDSSKGILSEYQMMWLAENIRKIDRERVMLFIHHPPIAMGVPYMDTNHALAHYESLRDLLVSYTDKIFDVFTGHYHVEKSLSFENINVYLTPSGWFQINSEKEYFEIAHKKIGYRRIILDLNKGGSYRILQNDVRYL